MGSTSLNKTSIYKIQIKQVLKAKVSVEEVSQMLIAPISVYIASSISTCTYGLIGRPHDQPTKEEQNLWFGVHVVLHNMLAGL